MIKKNSFTKSNQVNKTPETHHCRALQSRHLDVNKKGVNQPEKQQGHNRKHVRVFIVVTPKINEVINVKINHNNHDNKNKYSKNIKC